MNREAEKSFPRQAQNQIARLIESFRLLLAENLTGVYLHGSLSTGCFNPLRSDIDILAVTRDRTTIEEKRDLAQTLLDISMNPCPVEISFLARGDLRPWRYPTPFDFHFSEDWRGQFERELQNGDWKNWNAAVARFDDDLAAHITVLNHRGVCLYGRAVADVFPPVPKADFLDSVLGDVLGEKFGVGSRSAVLKYPVYVVLNSCRALAFLKNGGVMSKAEGGGWALGNLPADFHPVIAGALDEYASGTNESRLPRERLLDFAAYMKIEIGRASAADDDDNESAA